MCVCVLERERKSKWEIKAHPGKDVERNQWRDLQRECVFRRLCIALVLMHIFVLSILRLSCVCVCVRVRVCCVFVLVWRCVYVTWMAFILGCTAWSAMVDDLCVCVCVCVCLCVSVCVCVFVCVYVCVSVSILQCVLGWCNWERQHRYNLDVRLHMLQCMCLWCGRRLTHVSTHMCVWARGRESNPDRS